MCSPCALGRHKFDALNDSRMIKDRGGVFEDEWRQDYGSEEEGTAVRLMTDEERRWNAEMNRTSTPSTAQVDPPHLRHIIDWARG